MWPAGNTAHDRNRRSVAAAACRHADRARTHWCRHREPAAVYGRLLPPTSQRVLRAKDGGGVGRKACAKAVNQAEFGTGNLAFAAGATQLRDDFVEVE